MVGIFAFVIVLIDGGQFSEHSRCSVVAMSMAPPRHVKAGMGREELIPASLEEVQG